MYGKRVFFFVSLLGGIIILLIGINHKLNESVSGSYTFSKYGNLGYGTINGTSAIVLGFLTLLFSLWSYNLYKKGRIERQARLSAEKKEKIKFIIGNSKRDLRDYMFNRKEFKKKHNID